MRLLIITTSALMGGTERFIINFMKVFSKFLNIEVMFYKQTDCDVLQEMGKYANKIHILPYYVKKPLKFCLKIRRFYKNNQYDYIYIHANSSLSIFYTFPLWFKKNRKIMYHSHNSDGGNALLELFGRKIINKVCFKRFACSANAAKFMYGNKPAILIHNVIDLEKYRFNSTARENIRKELGVKNELVIGHVGRFNEQKNHMFLIDVFNEVLKIKKNSKLILIGEGEKKRDVLEKAKNLNITDNIIFVGKSNVVYEYYSAFDVFLLPSLYEGLPFVGIEAQAAGLPCLFSREVSMEVGLTPLAYFLDLSENKQNWAKTIVDLYEKSRQRKNYINLIENEGFGLESLKRSYEEVGLTI